MFRSIVNSKPVPKLSAFLFAKCIDQRFSAVNIEIVHDEVDGLCIGILIYDGFNNMSELRGGSVGSRRSEVATGLRFHNPKHISCATSFVFVIRSYRFPWFRRPRRAYVCVQCYRLLVQANYRFVRLIRFLIDRQYILHPFDVVPVQFCHAPHFFPATALGRGFQAALGWSLDQHGEPTCV